MKYEILTDDINRRSHSYVHTHVYTLICTHSCIHTLQVTKYIKYTARYIHRYAPYIYYKCIHIRIYIYIYRDGEASIVRRIVLEQRIPSKVIALSYQDMSKLMLRYDPAR